MIAYMWPLVVLALGVMAFAAVMRALGRKDVKYATAARVDELSRFIASLSERSAADTQAVEKRVKDLELALSNRVATTAAARIPIGLMGAR